MIITLVKYLESSYAHAKVILRFKERHLAQFWLKINRIETVPKKNHCYL